METSSSGRSCSFDGLAFPHGAERCSLDLCMLCEDGKFEIPAEQRFGEDDPWADPGEAYFLPA